MKPIRNQILKERTITMRNIVDHPLILCAITLVCLWIFARLGAFLRKRRREDQQPDKDEFGVVLSATLTLLGLLIGFSFSMAIGRYEQRKDYEEEEANAIGTEFLRADLLAEPVRQKVQVQLVQYLDLRIQRYRANASDDITELAAKTGQLQLEMWNDVKSSALANPHPVMATVVTGMNDVINRQGYTQAARWNRIPTAAWALMIVIAMFSNFLIGYGAKSYHNFTLLIVPLAISVSFLLIADIDSPQGGIIRVPPQNLIALSDSLKPQ
jgi:hypothetical protein